MNLCKQLLSLLEFFKKCISACLIKIEKCFGNGNKVLKENKENRDENNIISPYPHSLFRPRPSMFSLFSCSPMIYVSE